MKMPHPRRWLPLAGLLGGTALMFTLLAPAADHRDGPIFVNSAANGRPDINDMYVFQSPANVNNTVLVMTVSPFAGNVTPATFDQTVTFDFKIDNTGDAVEDLTFRVNFGAPNAQGVQTVTVRGLPSTKFPPTGIVAKGNTGANIPVAGGGMFRAAIQDDPFFFDAGGFNAFIAAGMGSPARPVGMAKNFFGPNANTLSMVLEIPRTRLRSSAGNPNIALWGRSERNGVQLDRMGRPAINTAIIPPVPRNNTARGARQNAFNAALPRNDRRDFRADMISILSGAYGRPRDMTANPPLSSADGLANLLLPDILTFNTNTPYAINQFPDGRGLRDDVIDIEYGLLTGGAITSDNVPDDNGTRITDGTNGTTAAFPYLGPPNLPVNRADNAPNP